MAKISETLAKNLKRLRGDLSREELAEKSGVNYSVIRRAELLEGMPREDALERLAGFFGVEPTDLFYPGEPPKPVRIKPDFYDAFFLVAETFSKTRRGKKNPELNAFVKRLLSESDPE